MRITSGTAKGQQLKIPKNRLLRPTTDKVREAIFSILSPLATSWSRGLDLYAGSGALGIEALSRNAEWVDFVDREPQTCAIIKQNLEKVGFTKRAHIYCCSVAKAISFLDSKYDLIFIDPPYSDSTIVNTMTQLANSKLLSCESIVVVSHATRSPLAESYDSLYLAIEKRYGDTCISIYQKAESPAYQTPTLAKKEVKS